MRKSHINVLAAQDSGIERDPASTDTAVDRQVVVATIIEIRSMLKEHRTLLIQEMEKNTVPITVRLQEIKGRIAIIQDDLDNLIQ